MAGPDKDIDIRTEMRIALWWRSLIGDYEYAAFDPDVMLDYYMALELRGPEEIRALVTERYMGRPTKAVLGIMTKAPHPPLWLVLKWLEHHEEKIHTGSSVGWGLAGSFVVLSFIFMTNLHSCVDMQTSNPLAMSPPSGTPRVTPYEQVQWSYGAPPAPPSTASQAPPTSAPAASSTQTGAQSQGIAGAASGSVSRGGTTGPTNSGASAGAASH